MGKGKGGRKRKRDGDGWSDPIVKENRNFEEYYKRQEIVPPSEWDDFMSAMRRNLPTTFRITGNKSHAFDIRDSLQSHYFPALTSLVHENEPVPPPKPIQWYPDSLAWQIIVRKEVIRKDPSFRKFQNFLVCEAEAGNISRQEAVSMIPPLLLDVQPHHKVIDLCAAPGSKTAQILEALNVTEKNSEGQVKWPSGLVIANDSDQKRCYLMIHQLNRSPSPTYMATCYDASQFPNLRIPGEDGKDEILKFDRILADVPCSGDGTMRKNETIWQSWTNKSAMGLHPLQIRILHRGLQMLAVHGRLVYSTCSLNPLENEAVVAEILRLTNGAVEIVDVSSELPALVRRPGMQSWKIFDANGEEMDRSEYVPGGKLTPTMFPPTPEEENIKQQLPRCLRVYPHLQDTGGFFITVLIKKSSLGGKKVDLPTPDTNGRSLDSPEPVPKKPKLDPSQPEFGTNSSKSEKNNTSRKEEPFVYLPTDHGDLEVIRNFFALSSQFPTTNLFVRNATGDPLRAIYITTPLVQELLNRNPAIRLLSAGTRLFVRQPDPNCKIDCLWRIHSDGLGLVDSFLGDGRVVYANVDEIWDLLKSGTQFPAIRSLSANLGDRISKMGNGGFVIRVDPSKSEITDMNAPFSMPMWKSPHAVNVMIQKLDKKALALRLFGKDTDDQDDQEKAEVESENRMESEEWRSLEIRVTPFFMPKKFGENTKKAAGNAKKAAANETRIAKAKEEEERKETKEWSKGAKSTSKAEAEEEKRKALAAKKAEKLALEAAERASLPSKPAANKRGEEKKATKKSGNLDDLFITSTGPALAASNIDDALDALSLTTGGEVEDGKAVAGIDRHPERRQKAALAAYEDKRLPELKQEHPGLRLQQYKDLIYKEFQKSPENPFNQVHAAHNSTRGELRELAAAEKRKIEQRLAEKS